MKIGVGLGWAAIVILMPGLVPYEGQSTKGHGCVIVNRGIIQKHLKSNLEFILRLYEAIHYGGNIKLCPRKDYFFGDN